MNSRLRVRRSSKAAFTLLEALVVLGALSSVTAVAITVARGVVSPTADVKLEADVRSMNRAIQTYRVQGGNLSGVKTAEAVVEKLKTVATDEDGKDKEIVGLKNSVIDSRVRVVRSGEGRRKGQDGARYNPEKQQFEVTSASGDGAIEAFDLNAAPAADVKEDRSVSLRGSKDNGWIWGYGDSRRNRDPLKAGTTTDVAVSDASTMTSSGTAVALTPLLNPPTSPTALSSFPLTVTISNPNPANTTQLYYSTNGASYVPYTAALSAAPGTTVRAVAVSLDPDNLLDSSAVQQLYAPVPVTLALTDTAPASVSYFQAGGTAASGSPAVTPLSASTISLANAAGIPALFLSSGYFQVEWSFAGTAANSAPFSNGYPGETFNITRSKYGSGSTVALSYRAVSLASYVFNTSAQASKTVGIARLSLATPKLTNSSSQVTLAPDFAPGAVPANYRIYYNLASDPGDNQGEPVSGTLYSAPFAAPASGGTVYARVYPPSDSKPWFNTSTAGTLSIPAQNNNYMGDFNVIVFNDLYTTTAIEGKAWIGGGLSNGNSVSLGRNYSPSAAENVIVVGGSLGSGNAFQMEGNSNSRLALTSSAYRGNRSINWNGGGNEASRLVYDSAIPSKTLTMQQQLQLMSFKLNTATATSTVVTPANQSNKRVLTCTPNAAGVAVFNITASSLFGASNLAEVTLDFASGVSESSVKGVLINVSGGTVQTGTQFNFGGKFTDDTWRKKILWNFPAAVTISMAAQRMDGAVLAPYASVTSNNDFKGSLACRQLNLSGTCFRLPFGSAEILAMGQ